jgi:hypothetical protein
MCYDIPKQPNAAALKCAWGEMQVRSALYYPHTTIRNHDLIRTGLLLWDRLEFIVPSDHYRPHYPSKRIAEAMELIGVGHRPNDEEKRDAHQNLRQAVARKLPPQFYFDRRAPFSAMNKDMRLGEIGAIYEMYPEKLFHRTWQMLRRAQLSEDYQLSAAGGLMVMSALADSCAGTTRSRVTDEGDAYATVAGLLGNNPGGPAIKKADAHGQLVAISLKVIDTSTVSIERLIQLRKREATETGHTLRDLRHRYQNGLETYAVRLLNERVTKADASEILRECEDDMKTDLRDLRAELGFARRDALLSKEILAFALTAVGTAASWLFGVPVALEGVVTAAGAPVAIGGLLAARNKYLKERRSILKEHPMAYLYETDLGASR